MGLFDKVKKILFDEEEIEELPVRTDKEEDKEEHDIKEIMKQDDKKGGVIIHNNNEEDTITEVKVPEEKPRSFAFPIMMDDDDEVVEELPKRERVQDTQQLRLQENELDRTREIERLREEKLNRTREDLINEYNETRRVQRETVEPRRENLNIPEKKEKVPYKVPPVISPVFGVLDKNYDPDTYEETRQKITMSNAGNTSALGERQFGPVSYNDQGIPTPKYHSQTIIVASTANPTDVIKEELKKEAEAIKEASKIEEEIIKSIINDDINTKDSIEDAFEDTKEVEIPQEKYEEPIEEVVEEPTIEYEEPIVEPEEDAVITGSPYDDILDDTQTDLQPTKDINDLIEETEAAEEADLTPDAPKNLEDNVDLDDTIETDLYNLIDSMYKDDE